MKKLLLTSLLLCCLPGTLLAQKALRQPLKAIAADSVMVWSNGTLNWRMTALAFNKNLQSQPYTAHKKDFSSLRQAWTTRRVNLAGGTGAMNRAEAVYSAGQTLSMAAQWFLLTGESQPIDYAERALYNLLPYTLRQQRLSDVERGAAAQSMLNAVGLIYAASEESVYVNFFVNSFAKIPLHHGQVAIDQITDMPYMPGTRLRVSGLLQGARQFTLRIRLPEWATAAATSIIVNGHEERPKVEQGYFVIDRTWNNQDEVYIRFPFTPRLVSNETGQQIVAHGALLFFPRRQGKTFPTDTSLLQIEPDSIAPFILKTADWEFFPLLFQ